VVASIARKLGALTIGVVTRPFSFEGKRRAKQADDGITALRNECDTLIVIPNDRLLQLGDVGVSLMDAFRSADEVLLSGVQGITDLITTPGLINLDFADVKSVMSGAGSALMGIGSARGEGRAVQAAQKAINSPLLEASMDGAHGVLLAIAGGSDLGLFEINESASLVQEAAHPDANIIFGTVIDDSLGDEVRVTVIAAGFDSGGPTHKKLEPTALTSPPRSTTATAVAESGQLSAPPPQPQPVQQHTQPPVYQHATPPPSNGYTAVPPANTGYQPQSNAGQNNSGNSGLPPVSRPNTGNGYPASPERHGSLPSRAVPLPEDPDDEVDVPPFMRR
jgi:cell division protein FtsZ